MQDVTKKMLSVFSCNNDLEIFAYSELEAVIFIEHCSVHWIYISFQNAFQFECIQ